MPEGAKVQDMLTHIAPRYDVANRVLSAGIDRRWRRLTVGMAGAGPDDRVLDVCTGTGDLAIDLAKSGSAVVGSDFTFAMLRRSLPKVRALAGLAHAPTFVAGDTTDLPFQDDSFDLVTVAFGIRNVSDPLHGLREMRRVTRPGGRVVVLEFCKPRVPVVGGLYRFYFRRILPVLGRLISGDTQGAYSYLPQSVMAFPERGEFLELMREAGLTQAQQKILSLGIAAIYRAEVPA
jgi:demethylmenaquinone methyltransferase/2-methoxy-6-polyprenyl-1,4-benzoquinol methylase